MRFGELPASHGKETAALRSTVPLQLRLFFRRHMTDLVRLFGHQELELGATMEHLEKLRKQYGNALIDEAFSEIVEYVPDKTHIRLTAEVKRLASSLLGPITSQSPIAPEPADSNALEQGSGDGTRRAMTMEASERQPVTSRKRILAAYRRQAEAAGQILAGISPGARRLLEKRNLLSPDAIIDGDTAVTVRSYLTDGQRRDMHAWLAVYDTLTEAIRTWPTDQSFEAWTVEVVARREPAATAKPPPPATESKKKRPVESPSPPFSDQLRRRSAISLYRAYLESTGQEVTPISSEMQQALREQGLLVPDFGVEQEIVTVRKKLSAKDLSDMKQWVSVFGEFYDAVQVWPTREGSKRVWVTTVIAGGQNDPSPAKDPPAEQF